MDEELSFLRAIAANPYDRIVLGAYADWLAEHGRPEEEAAVRGHAEAFAPAVPGNSVTVGDLIGHLLTLPLGAPVLFRRYSDYATLRLDEVQVKKAEQREVTWRWQCGYRVHDDCSADQEPPNFVTVVCFPGN